jgi:hypothetical protein
MHEQVTERKAEVAAAAGGNTRADAFTMLVKANQDESSKYQLDDQELACLLFVPFSSASLKFTFPQIGNVFLFMVCTQRFIPD